MYESNVIAYRKSLEPFLRYVTDILALVICKSCEFGIDVYQCFKQSRARVECIGLIQHHFK